MSAMLFLLLYLSGHVVAEHLPDVDCMVVHLEHVRCSWNNPNPAAAVDRLYGRFEPDQEKECNVSVECVFPYNEINRRFTLFYTRLVRGNATVRKTHSLKKKVKLHPPTNLTVKRGPDSNLWFYWNQTVAHCVENEVRFRTRNRKWESSTTIKGEHSYCIHLPSSKYRYELQVRSKIHEDCGGSVFWSGWCDPVAWGSNFTSGEPHTDTLSYDTEPKRPEHSVPVWTVVLCLMGSATAVLLALMLLQRERLRVIFIPVVPKPLIPPDIENWLQISKGLKEGFKTSYNDLACPVREFSPLTLSTSCLSAESSASVSSDCQ
ncbi:LOW QUALITY PROTEIN: cytokine receptor common subunit gamma-like [Neosynchiropus ocellatus]